MTMTDGEIRRTYKTAKDKKKQISILADLNGCNTSKILAIVHGNRSNEMTEPAPPKPSTEAENLIRRLDELDAMIKPLEEEYKRTAAELMRITKAD